MKFENSIKDLYGESIYGLPAIRRICSDSEMDGSTARASLHKKRIHGRKSIGPGG